MILQELLERLEELQRAPSCDGDTKVKLITWDEDMDIEEVTINTDDIQYSAVRGYVQISTDLVAMLEEAHTRGYEDGYNVGYEDGQEKNVKIT